MVGSVAFWTNLTNLQKYPLILSVCVSVKRGHFTYQHSFRLRRVLPLNPSKPNVYYLTTFGLFLDEFFLGCECVCGCVYREKEYLISSSTTSIVQSSTVKTSQIRIT